MVWRFGARWWQDWQIHWQKFVNREIAAQTAGWAGLHLACGFSGRPIRCQSRRPMFRRAHWRVFRQTARLLEFQSNKYTMSGVTTHTNIEDQYIIVTASFDGDDDAPPPIPARLAAIVDAFDRIA